MAETQIAQIQVRRDTAANWTSEDPTLASGEWGLETDTDKLKMGDGSTAWSSLDYNYQPETICTAWVNFNGTGTVAIRDSYNVSSITDNGTGDYTVNFENAMDNANYCPVGMGGLSGGRVTFDANSGSALTTSLTVGTLDSSGGRQDCSNICIAILGGKD